MFFLRNVHVHPLHACFVSVYPLCMREADSTNNESDNVRETITELGYSAKKQNIETQTSELISVWLN